MTHKLIVFSTVVTSSLVLHERPRAESDRAIVKISRKVPKMRDAEVRHFCGCRHSLGDLGLAEAELRSYSNGAEVMHDFSLVTQALLLVSAASLFSWA